MTWNCVHLSSCDGVGEEVCVRLEYCTPGHGTSRWQLRRLIREKFVIADTPCDSELISKIPDLSAVSRSENS